MAADIDILTLEEAQAVCKTSSAGNAPDITAMVTGLTGWCDKLCGPFVARAITATFSAPCSGGLLLTGRGIDADGRRVSVTPVYEITEIIETIGGTPTTLDEDDWRLDADEHLAWLYRRTGGTDSTWPYGTMNLALTLQAGRAESTATVDYDVKERFRSLLQEKWQYEAATWQRNRGEFTTDEAGNPVGFNAEARIRELFASELLPPGIA